ncbi:DUF6680 family protein [Colwelliaceae bacterium 6471]
MSEPQVIFDITGPAVIFATLAGPLLAVWASEWRHSRRNKQEKRESVFRTLMSTRATRLNIVHVEALNQIDFVFDGNRYKQIRESWSLYRKHLQSPDSASTGDAQAVWQSKGVDLFSDLLHEISKGLNLPFTKSYIIENSYRPDAHLLEEIDNIKMRQLLMDWLENGVPIKVQNNNQ